MTHYDTTNDTIVAIATATGRSGISIIRLSGPDALDTARAILQVPYDPASNIRKMILARVLENTEIIDEALVCYMKSPHSYTGDDVVEIQCHGGYSASRAILDACVNKGARIAEPGEFTKRAFINGRIDLVQAESVMEIVSAQGREHLRRAERLMDGTFSRRIETILDELNNCMSLLELNIEFIHQGGIDAIRNDELTHKLRRIEQSLENLITSYESGKRIRDGLRVVIAGKVNAGKSSLFNALLGRKRAIVNKAPGTTRDWIEEKIDLDGLSINLIDTAGLRITPDDIEREGVLESERLLNDADIIIHLLEGNESETLHINIDTVLPENIITVRSKSDLYGIITENKGAIAVSSVTGKGMSQLKNEIAQRAHRLTQTSDNDSVVLIERHRNELILAHDSLEQALESINDWTEEVTMLDLKVAQKHMEAIIGRNVDIDVLDTIFSNFCIGK